jgi:ABC-type Fe3+-hydroxamate transport system substrate-binding protein
MADIAKANPDVIIITGESFPVQKRLNKALKKNSSLFDIPAVKNHEIYSLPSYIDSSVIEYPHILRLWIAALYK